MADKKISALPPASTPLAGTEVLPIVQGGITEQVSVSNLTNGRDVLAANLGIGGAVNASYKITSYGAISSTVGASFFAGTVGVGTTPLYKLDVIVGAGASNMLRVGQTGLSNGLTISSTGSELTYQFDNGNVKIGTAGKGITNSTGSVALNFGASGVTLSAGTATMSAYGAGFAVFNSSGVISSTRNLASNTQTKSVAIGATQNLFYVNDYKLSASGFMTIRSSDASGVTIKTFVFNIMGNGIATGLVQLASEDYGGAASTFTVAETRNSPGAPNNQISLTNTSGVASTVEVSYQFISGYENVTFI